MRALGAIAAALALALLPAAPGLAAQPAEPPASLTELEGEVMCPVCGTLLELAESPQAQREKAFIARLVAEGRSKAEVKEALVAQYGEEVLALPQGSGFSLSAYLVPIVAFLIALIALALGVRRWRRSGGGRGANGDRPTPPPAGPTGEDSERLAADLAKYDL
ncbi:MAG TPA: cytochrome c-type biogenesis protein CcmH [Solirubrobacterales bacterium]|nr:cytochrome c-type biogenesis protein CcmH [Solirubrobacterales bacterium]